jgi:hypothetical protein
MDTLAASAGAAFEGAGIFEEAGAFMEKREGGG